MKFGNIRKTLLVFCLTLSVAFHAGLVWILYASPPSFSDTTNKMAMKPSPISKVTPMDDEELLTKKLEKALEESLNVVTLAHSTNLQSVQSDIAAEKAEEKKQNDPDSLHEERKVYTRSPQIHENELELIQMIEAEFATSLPPAFDPETELSLSDFALDDELDENPLPYESEKYASVDFSNSKLYSGEAVAPPELAYKDDYSFNETANVSIAREDIEGLSPNFIRSLEKLKTAKNSFSEDYEREAFTHMAESTSPKLVLPNSVNYLREQWIKKSLAECKLPDLEHYGLETISNNIEWNDDLEIDLSIMNDPKTNKYVFSMTIHPELELDIEPMQQTFYFLIDRSSSIKKTKFSRFKRAVVRAMAALREGDKFNICVFDKKIIKLADTPVPVTAQVIKMAEDFLDRQQPKTFFAAGELFSSLSEILPKSFDTDEMHSIILITDGNTSLSSKKQQTAIDSWAQEFKGNVQFYTAAAGKGNNLVNLDLLSYSMQGKMLYSDTNAAFPRKLVRLVKDLHDPLIKNISVEVSAKDSKALVQLFPHHQFLPPIFGTQPYQIVGTVDEICDLTVFIQGRNHDRHLNIRKKISLKNAKRGGRALEKLWAQAQVKDCYESFLRFGKSSHLLEAKQIVAPYKGAISLDQ